MSQLVVLIASFYFKAHPQHYAIQASPANNLLIMLMDLMHHEHGNATVSKLPWPQIVPWGLREVMFSLVFSLVKWTERIMANHVYRGFSFSFFSRAALLWFSLLSHS
jgi:hypothetical protein